MGTKQREERGHRIAGRYLVARRLARGGMGTVYEALDESTGQRVALKRLALDEGGGGTRRKPGQADRLGMALFEREYYTLARLKHPRIIEVYDYGVDASGPYFTMELLDGRDMRELAPIPYRRACHLIRDIASSLALLHAHRLVHRDVSPRNVRVTKDGHAKLFDFGSLAAFGVPADVCGTPSCVPFEALNGLPLDHRADLYSLGCVAYWLLTGTEAFPARNLDDLVFVWKRKPRRPSRIVCEIPSALDELILSLLSSDPLARPSSAAAVIDRINHIAGLEPEPAQVAARSYLVSSKTVGYDDALDCLNDSFSAVTSGHGGGLLIEAERGQGKTRLLGEASIRAQLSGAIVLHVDAAAHPGPMSPLRVLAARLLQAAPEEASTEAASRASGLGHFLPELFLGTAPVPYVSISDPPGEQRARVQAALRGWFLDVAGRRAVVVAVDNLDQADESSAGFIAALCREASSRRLLVVAAVTSGARSSAIRALRMNCKSIELEGLDRPATSELVECLFGSVPNTERLADWIHANSAGNPLASMALVEHLVHERFIRYVDGAWVLPAELPSSDLPKSFDDAVMARLSRLSRPARDLLEPLSVGRGPLPLEVLLSFGGADTRRRQSSVATLDELVSQGLLISAGDGYRFAQESLREAIYRSLDGERRTVAHSKLGAALLAGSPESAMDAIEAGWHLICAGDADRGADLLAAAGRRLFDETDDLHAAVPALEAALRVYQRQERSVYELIPLVAPLATAAFFVDRRLADRYGEAALAMFRNALGLEGAETAGRFFGRRLGLLVGIGRAKVRYATAPRESRPASFDKLCQLFLRSAVALAGAGCTCLDPRRVRAVVAAMEPLTALGTDHGATFSYRYCQGLLWLVEGRPGDAHRQMRQLLEELDSGKAYTAFPEYARRLFTAGALYALGALESMRDGPSVLTYAARLEMLDLKLYDMVANQLRMLYHAHRGESDLARAYRSKVETYAIQRGTAWQVEVWELPVMLVIQGREGDVVGLRRTLEGLESLAAEIPALEAYAQLARGTYLRLQGHPAQAMHVFERLLQGVESAQAGSVPIVAALAEVYNEVGQFERALDLTRTLLSQSSVDDQSFVRLYLPAQIQLALATAGLGRAGEAARLLDEWLEANAPGRGPVTLGLLHEARARVALGAGDDEAFSRHRDHMARWLRPTANPALIALCERLDLEASRRSTRDRLGSRPSVQIDTARGDVSE